MKNILMIGTGGTIASKQTEYGLAPGLSAEDILNYIPAVSKICEVDSLQVCNLDSTNVTPEHWKLLAKTVQEIMTGMTDLSSVMARIRWRTQQPHCLI